MTCCHRDIVPFGSPWAQLAPAAIHRRHVCEHLVATRMHPATGCSPCLCLLYCWHLFFTPLPVFPFCYYMHVTTNTSAIAGRSSWIPLVTLCVAPCLHTAPVKKYILLQEMVDVCSFFCLCPVVRMQAVASVTVVPCVSKLYPPRRHEATAHAVVDGHFNSCLVCLVARVCCFMIVACSSRRSS